MTKIIQMVPGKEKNFFITRIGMEGGCPYLEYRVSSNPKELISDFFEVEGEMAITAKHHIPLIFLYKFCVENQIELEIFK